MTAPLLTAEGISKAFNGAPALTDVAVTLHAGEVLALVGENGAGKSTLMKILAGVYLPDAGTLQIDGQPVRLTGVNDALRFGISLIHQELNLAENLSVAANLYLGREPTRFGWLRWLDERAMHAGARGLLERVGLKVAPEALVGDLPPGHRQLVEIARSLSLQARILIMDEPTSSLTQAETDRLFTVIADLKRQGVAVVYISHRLAEVRHLADRAVVLRDGRNAGALARADITHESLIQCMVGRDLKQVYPTEHLQQPVGALRLDVRDLRYPGNSAPLSLQLHAGEIVGMAGLVGAGRTELAETLFGIRPMQGGRITLDGQPLVPTAPPIAIAAGLVLVPEDRRRHGLVLEEAIRDNFSLPNLNAVSVARLVSPPRERQLTQGLADRLRVKCAHLGQNVGELSGGNQQKVVVGKWIARLPKVLIVDEPTRGVDVGARSEMYALLDELARQGVAILLISSDLEEVLGMSRRVVVLHEGRLAGELGRSELSEQAVMRLATGAKGNP
jgi:ribose transport system ATP-binding protein